MDIISYNSPGTADNEIVESQDTIVFLKKKLAKDETAFKGFNQLKEYTPVHF
jgi:hypothetical protein